MKRAEINVVILLCCALSVCRLVIDLFLKKPFEEIVARTPLGCARYRVRRHFALLVVVSFGFEQSNHSNKAYHHRMNHHLVLCLVALSPMLISTHKMSAVDWKGNKSVQRPMSAPKVCQYPVNRLAMTEPNQPYKDNCTPLHQGIGLLHPHTFRCRL